MAFNLSAAKRIKDRGIIWKEQYTKKTLSMKKRFEKEIGPGSYFRFEGHDNTTGNDYYIVCGPGHSKTKGNLFFTGIRKLPGEYSPNGEYFKTHRKAMLYAKDMWGVRFPKDFQDYTQEDLVTVRI
jgi:hypothetical protein